MPKKFFIGVFDDEDNMTSVAKKLQESQIPISDIYTPYPMHIDHLLGIKRSRLPYITLVAGVVGCAFALGAQYWISAIDWPIIVGGKPFNSLPAFIPIAFEITILFGAFITAFAFFSKARLMPRLNAKVIHPRASQDRFVIALESNDASLDLKKIEGLFFEHGALEATLKEV